MKSEQELLAMLEENPLLAKREAALKIAGAHGVTRLRLFGSFGHGMATQASDIDLLVDLEPGRSLLDLVALKQDLEDLFGRRVDVVTEAALSPYLRDQILREAVLV